MKLEKIYLDNFRNYGQLEIEFAAGLNLITGANAQGKTNLLEAIFYLSRGTSARSTRDQDLIFWEREAFKIEGNAQSHSRSIRIEINVPRQGTKKIKINGVAQKKIQDLLGNFTSVIFSPDDLELIKSGPRCRRLFMDHSVSQLVPVYNHYLLQYQKVLGQRNHLLRLIGEQKAGSDELEVWSDQLAAIGAKIIFRRLEYLKKITPLAREIHAQLTDRQERLSLKYFSSLALAKTATPEQIKEFFLNQLQVSKITEIRRGQTTSGPHLDDLLCLANERDLRLYGSQGQQRTAVLALKIAEMELLRLETGEYPVLLLDDVSSELDEQRRSYLLQIIDKQAQTFLTTTEELPVPSSGKIRRIRVINGQTIIL